MFQVQDIVPGAAPLFPRLSKNQWGT